MALSPPGSSNNDHGELSPDSKFKAITYALQHQMVLYKDASARATSSPDNPTYQADQSSAAEKLVSILRNAADLPPDPSTGQEWRSQADQFAKSSPEERENALKEIGIGLLKVLAAPFALAGLGIYAAGEIVTGVGRATGQILTGVGSILKGIGKFGKAALLDQK